MPASAEVAHMVRRERSEQRVMAMDQRTEWSVREEQCHHYGGQENGAMGPLSSRLRLVVESSARKMRSISQIMGTFSNRVSRAAS